MNTIFSIRLRVVRKVLDFVAANECLYVNTPRNARLENISFSSAIDRFSTLNVHKS